MIKKILFSIIMLCYLPLFAEEKMRIAVMDFKADGVSDRLVRMASEMVRDKFINSGKFIVVERAQMDSILQEQGLQQSGCTDSACAVEVGKLLSAKKILVGTITQLDKIDINVRIVDVEKGTSEFSARDKATSEDLVEQAIERINIKLLARIEGKNVDDSEFKEVRKVKMSDGERSTNGFKAMGISIIPGLGQIVYGGGLNDYQFSLVEGFFFMGVTGIFGYFTYWSYADMKKKQKAYRDLPVNLSQSRYDSKYNDANKAKSTFNIFLITTAGFYILNFIDAYFAGSRPDTRTVIGSAWSQPCGGLFVNYAPVRGGSSSGEFTAGYMERF